MQKAKILLAEMAKRLGCSTDDLLAAAEAENVDVFAVVQPCTTTLRNRLGQPVFGSPKATVNTRRYSVLLPHEVSVMRADDKVPLKVVRAEGVENGILLSIVRSEDSGDGCELLAEREEFHPWLDEPQTVTIDQLYLNHDSKLPVDMIPPAPMTPANSDTGLREFAEAVTNTLSKLPDLINDRIQSAQEAHQSNTQPIPSSRPVPVSSFPTAPQFNKDTSHPSSKTKFLATGKELLDAFGCSATLFDYVSKYPELKAARKVLGRGGKNPIDSQYDPWLVAEFLADRKGVHGMPVNRVWMFFEKHFPDRYAEVDGLDPRKK